MADNVKVVYGTNPSTGWGLLATIDDEGKIKHSLVMLCPGFAGDQEFVVALQKLALDKLAKDGLVLDCKVEEKQGS